MTGKARVFMHRIEVGILEELRDKRFLFTYHDYYHGAPISLTMPVKEKSFYFTTLPPFFEGLLPVRREKEDLFEMLMKLGKDTVGAVSVEETV